MLLTDTGIVRAVDKLNRLTIPMEIMRGWKAQAGDPMKIFMINDDKCSGMVISPYFDSCIFCGSKDNLSKFKGVNICFDCKEGMLS